MKKYNGFQISWWIAFIYAVLIIITQYIIDNYFHYMNNNIKLLIFQSLIIVPIIIGFVCLKKIFPYDNLKNMLSVKGFNITLLPLFIILPICAMSFINYITAPFNSAFTELFGEYKINISAPNNIYELIVQFTLFCIISPILNELLFRGIMIKLFDKYGTVLSVLMSSLASAMLCFNYSIFIPAYLFAVLMAIIRLGSDSVAAGTMLHIYNNYFVYMYIIFKNRLYIPNTVLFGINIILCLLFPLLIFIFFKFYSKKFYFLGTEKKAGFSFGFLFTAIIFIFSSLFMKIAFLF